MSQIVDVTGTFLDIGGNPLSGSVTVDPLPAFIVSEEKTTIYSGSVTGNLDSEGNLALKVLSNPGWKYLISFNLASKDGQSVELAKEIIDIPGEDTVPNLLAITYKTGSYKPVFEFAVGDVGELIVTGVTTDPNDPGAIVLDLPAE